MQEKTQTECFEEEVKELLRGYISDPDTADYLAYKIAKVHESYVEK